MVSSQDPPQTPPFHWQHADLDDTTTYQFRGRTLFYVVTLFAIILLASLLFFYARWVCSTRRHYAYPSSSSSQAAAEDGARRRRGVGGGLEAAVIGAFPVLLYGSELAVEGAEECCICLSLFEEDEKVKVLPGCNHCFHSECVDRWLVCQSSCPLCRSSLRFDQQSAAVATQIFIDY